MEIQRLAQGHRAIKQYNWDLNADSLTPQDLEASNPLRRFHRPGLEAQGLFIDINYWQWPSFRAGQTLNEKCR